MKRSVGFLGSLALKFGGFRGRFEALIAPLERQLPPDAAADFLAARLGELCPLASRNPRTALSAIERNVHDPVAALLLRVACGDARALLDLQDAISDGRAGASAALCRFASGLAAHRPADAKRLITSIFTRADTGTRLMILKDLVGEGGVGDGRMIGEFFIQLMARSTPDERAAEIYPALMGMASPAGGGGNPRKSFLAAMLKGWASETQGEERDALRRFISAYERA